MAKKEKGKIDRKKMIIILIVSVVVLLIVIGIIETIRIKLKKGPDQLITTSTLAEVVNISELSTAEFIYNGIAEVYKDEKKEKIKCYIKYNAKVKASIDMKLVNFEINNEDKTVKPILPEIILTPTIIAEESGNFSYIPENTKIELQEIISRCKEDAQEESLKSNELLEIAKENLKDTVEALIYPILEFNEYKIIWE